MVNKPIYRRNESCVVGLPRCDYVFNSNRSCFIAYGFQESSLEMEILRGILVENNIEVFEAGGDIEPGKNAFCTKICSKIITSQFCIVILNQEKQGEIKVPNANVNLEYGLMLGFNKYIIPFQREGDNLPFNVAGLDTIKYHQSNFKEKAQKAIKRAIEQTKPEADENIPIDRIIDRFLLIEDAFVSPIDDPGHKNIYELGSPFGYYLLNDFTGLKYHFLGVFNLLSIEQIQWRIRKLDQVITARFGEDALNKKIEWGITSASEKHAVLGLKDNMSGWIIIHTEEEKLILQEFAKDVNFPFEFFSLIEINRRIIEEGI